MKTTSKPATGISFSSHDGDLIDKKWRLDRYGYAKRSIRIDGKPTYILAHHEVCLREFGRRPDWLKHEVCDHINRNKLDNRRENLRIVHTSENSKNKAVSRPTFHKRIGKWQAQATVNKKNHYLGVYSDYESAQQAINDFAKSNGRIIES